MSSKEALIELQMLLMDQQRSLDSLSEQLVAQADKIMLLEKKIEGLQSRLTMVGINRPEATHQPQPTDDQKPPHY